MKHKINVIETIVYLQDEKTHQIYYIRFLNGYYHLFKGNDVKPLYVYKYLSDLIGNSEYFKEIVETYLNSETK